MRTTFLVGLLCLLGSAMATAGEGSASYFLIHYSPGPNWDQKLDYDAQLGIKDHKTHLQKLYDNDVIVMGGPLVREPGAMLIVRTGTFEQAQSIVDRDPAIVNRILNARVSGWRLEMSTMRQFKRSTPDVTDPNEPFRLQRVDQDSPINIRDQSEED